MTIGSRGVREKNDGHADPGYRLKFDPGSVHPVAKEGIGNSQQEASAIARTVIRSHGSSMADAMERCEGGVDNASAGSPSSVSDETDPAGVVLEPRVVQARVTQVSYSRYRLRPHCAMDDRTKRVGRASTFHTSWPFETSA